MAGDPKVSIVNVALGQLGQEPVVDLSAASLAASNATVKILRVLDDARDAVLARHGFLCAMEYAELQPSNLAGSWKYPTVYLLPGGALEVWEIGGFPLTDYYSTFWRPRWEVGTRDTDQGPQKIIRARNADAGLNVAYTRRASWGALETLVRDAVAYEAAARAAYSVTGDVQRASQLEKRAQEKIAAAIAKEGTQEGGQEPLAPSIPAALRNYSR